LRLGRRGFRLRFDATGRGGEEEKSYR